VRALNLLNGQSSQIVYGIDLCTGRLYTIKDTIHQRTIANQRFGITIIEDEAAKEKELNEFWAVDDEPPFDTSKLGGDGYAMMFDAY
jgi:hypothetical protein